MSQEELKADQTGASQPSREVADSIPGTRRSDNFSETRVVVAEIDSVPQKRENNRQTIPLDNAITSEAMAIAPTAEAAALPAVQQAATQVTTTEMTTTQVVPLPTPKPLAARKKLPPASFMLPRLRARSKSMALLSFFLLVIVPTACVGWYYFKIATPMYISETKLAFKKGDSVLNVGTGDFLSSIMGNAANAVQDVLIVVAYIKSPEAMRDTDEALDLRTHYANPDADFYSRLPEGATQDQFYRYWKNVVYAKIDTESGLMNLSVRAYTPEAARDISLFIYEKCEALVNQLNDRFRGDSLRRAINEVARSEQKVHEASVEMERFRIENNILDLDSSAGIRMNVIRDLETEMARVKADISAKRPFLAENHPEMQTLRAKLAGLQNQIDEEQRKVANESSNTKTIAAMAAEFERKSSELAFARKQHELSLTSLENARVQVDNKTTYIVPVVNPMLPDEALYPKPLLYTSLFFLANLVAFGFVSMIYSSLKDHLGV